MTIAQKIKQIRELKGYTQEHLASKLGITQSNYSKMESGGDDIVYSKIVDIAKALDITPEQLLAFDGAKYLNSFNNVKGNNIGSINIQIESAELKKLYGNQIKIFEKLVEKLEHELLNYKEKFGNIF